MYLHRIRQTALSFASAVIIVSNGQIVPAVPIGKFVDVKPVAGLDSDDLDCCPTISPDGLHFIFTSHRATGGSDLFEARRSTTNEAFLNVSTLGPEFNTSRPEVAGSFSSDGLEFYFSSVGLPGEGGHDLFVATRSGTDQPFANVTSLGAAINTPSLDADPSISSDGLTVIFESNRPGSTDGRSLFEATRASKDQPFNSGSLIESIDQNEFNEGPSLSSDGLTLFFGRFPSPRGELWVASREATDQPFQTPVNLNDFSLGSHINAPDEITLLQPYISPDWPAIGSKLYFTYVENPNGQNIFGISEWDIYEATWIVPEPSSVFLVWVGLLGIIYCILKERHARM